MLYSNSFKTQQRHLPTSCIAYVIQFNQIVEVIENNCKIAKENNDPEKRKYAIQAIQALIEEVGFSSEKLN